MILRMDTSLELIQKDEKGNFFADPYSILAMWREYFFKLFNVYGFKDVRHRNTHRSVQAKCL
jgi:hypothetical protein